MAPMRVCTKVIAPATRARGKTGKLLVFDVMVLYILLDVLRKTGVLLVRIAPPPPRASRGLRRLAHNASKCNDLFLSARVSLSLSLCRSLSPPRCVHATARA